MSGRNSSGSGPSTSGMTDNSDVTLEVLKNIRDDIRDLRGELRTTNDRLDALIDRVDTLTVRVDTGFAAVNQRVDLLTERVETGFGEVNRRFDGTLAIAGGHHTELESRVQRIEDHLGLSNG